MTDQSTPFKATLETSGQRLWIYSVGEECDSSCDSQSFSVVISTREGQTQVKG